MVSVGYDERWLQGKILVWMNEIVREHGLPFEAVEQEVKISTPKGLRRYPDLIVWYKKPDKIACLIELKVPAIDVYSDDLVDDALQKATLVGIPFFATWNLNKLVLWETFKPGTSLLDRRLKHWDVVDVKLPSDVERPEVEKAVKAFILEFLTELADFYEHKLLRPEVYVLPKLYPDEIMILRLRSAVDALYIPFSLYALQRKKEDLDFLHKVAEWFASQGWIFKDAEEDYDRLARQTVYLLINKLLFYNVLRSRFKLEPIDVSRITNGEELKKQLQKYFNTGIKLGFGIIFASDFLETIPIPDEAVDELKRLIVELNKYDFSELGYDIIGRVFEKLIPATERHKLGQYFTRSDVVDLILGFTVKHPDAKVLDPACGSGTFLVRAYQRKKYLAEKFHEEGKYDKPDKPHGELISELWGIDVAKFPAHLSVINLVIRNLEALKNRPNIACRDFFEIRPGSKTLLYELAYELPEIRVEELEVEFPANFDAVVTNPPYTRQEKMEHIFMKEYKERLGKLVREVYGINVGKRSGIYAYFFYHGGSFIREGGRIGLVTSNSWLDADFGKYLQEYFLKFFKIIAIIESKVERWFEDADIITAITILEKCSDKKARDENVVKFVQLKVPLKQLIPEVDDKGLEREKKHWEAIDRLVRLIEETEEYYEDDKIRIFPKKQAELWDEGYDDENDKYVGAKWGKYIRAPEIFFKILMKGQRLLIPLSRVANVRFGIKTGADEFFYLTEEEIKKWGIEPEFWTHIDEETGECVPNYIIKSPRDSRTIAIDPSKLKHRVLIIGKDKEQLRGTNALKYILYGEEMGYHRTRTCSSRKRWYDLGLRSPAPLLFPERFWDRFIVFYNPRGVLENKTLYGVLPFKPEYIKPLGAYLNSTIAALMIELFGRSSLGQGVLDIDVWMVEKIPVIDPEEILKDQKTFSTVVNAFEAIKDREIPSIFEEVLGQSFGKEELKKMKIASLKESVKLDNINPTRLKLDEAFFDMLGLNQEERLEVYRAVVDLVASRIKRAASVNTKKKKGDIDVEAIAESILKRINVSVKRFPEDYLSRKPESYTLEFKVPKSGEVIIGSDLDGFYVKTGEKELYRGWDQPIAEYIYYSILSGNTEIKVPADGKLVAEAVSSFKKDLDRLIEEIDKLVETTIPDAKIREEVRVLIWRKITKRLRK